ncbi:MAG: archaemetzincin family Zn-dependent metalloprotease [bacterium]|nr:MAG: archaemetzincin family Zn-dependent metalloprotease [bacterium]
MKKELQLIPVGTVCIDLLHWLVEALGQSLPHRAVIGEEVAIPVDGFDNRREQYTGESILAALKAIPNDGTWRLVGLVDEDCYTSGLNFIFGQAVMGGREAFVALPRLRQSFYGYPEDEKLFHERTLKEIMHEFGHTWGLSHCSDLRCVMHFSNSLADTDAKGAEYCSLCRARIG